MIVWSGWGILVALLPTASMIVAQLLTQALLGPAGYRQYNGVILPPLLLASALAVWLIGRRLNRGEGRVVTDNATGERLMLKQRHAFFFVRMEYWAVVLAAAAVWVAFGGLR